ncbi:PaaX family transcriptional regulator C-terminal domain-containing protein [Glutamicibacter sp. NPDC127525]|uniref:PaaX family transcriptional regulator n=1 Tax=unclassified Glutamicibacter TaxID=2627139 RepID=UPI00363705B2
MKPRGIVIDLFGDYLRYRGGRARLRDLTALLECFGIGESTARVMLARLRKEGWFSTEPDPSSRGVIYALTEKSWRILDEGRERIFTRADSKWGGLWHMVIYYVPEPERTLREHLRKELSWLGFGKLAASTWICPHDRLATVEERFAGTPAVRLDLLHSRSKGLTYDRDMAQRCWDLEELNHDYMEFVEQYRQQLPLFRSNRMSAREALVERTRMIQDYRKFPFRDPDLSTDLLPAGWMGYEAHELFLEARAALRSGAEGYVDTILGISEQHNTPKAF